MTIRKIPDLPAEFTDPPATFERLKQLASEFLAASQNNFHQAAPYRATRNEPGSPDMWPWLMCSGRAAAYRHAAGSVLRLWLDFDATEAILDGHLSACDEGACGHTETSVASGILIPDTPSSSTGFAGPAAKTSRQRAIARRPVFITGSATVKEELMAYAHAAGVSADCTSSVPQGRKLARQASLAVVGADLAHKVRKPITCPHGPVIVAAAGTGDMSAHEGVAERLGAEMILGLPQGKAWLTSSLAGLS